VIADQACVIASSAPASSDIGGDPMFVFRLTPESMRTLPEPLLSALHVDVGDDVACSVEDGRVVLTKAGPQGREDPFCTFDEWDSEADRKAYAHL
jgi:antitoxin PrlF